MSLSKPRTYSDDTPYQPPTQQYWIGRDKADIQYTVQPELHWSEKLAMGYKATAWPKVESDRDDERYDLKEKEL